MTTADFAVADVTLTTGGVPQAREARWRGADLLGHGVAFVPSLAISTGLGALAFRPLGRPAPSRTIYAAVPGLCAGGEVAFPR